MVMALERAVGDTGPRRSAQTLRRQMDEVAWFLRMTVSPEEAEAMAHAGYRCGCAARDCPRCNDDPEEIGETSRRGKRARMEPRFVNELLGRLSLFPRFLYVGVPRELARLPADERLVLLLACGAGLHLEVIASRLKLSAKTVVRLRERGLETIARALWTERGAVRYGA